MALTKPPGKQEVLDSLVAFEDETPVMRECRGDREGLEVTALATVLQQPSQHAGRRRVFLRRGG